MYTTLNLSLVLVLGIRSQLARYTECFYCHRDRLPSRWEMFVTVLRSWRPSRRFSIIASAVFAVVAFAGGGVAYAAVTGSPAIKTFTPRSERDITNLDVLRQQIRNYYGDPLGTGVAAPDGNYAKEASGVARDGKRYLAQRHHTHGTKAILLDVDDTTLLTWNYEIASNWAYNPTTNAAFV